MATALPSGMEGRRKKKAPTNKYGQFSVSAEAPQADSKTGPRAAKSNSQATSAAPKKDEVHNIFEFDPQIKASFSKNFQFFRKIFSIDTLFSPLPLPMRQGLSRNFGFFGRIFTQFSDPNGIRNARRSIGLENESDRPSFGRKGAR
eukprot:TRINITY_DN354_c4_g1_i6.p1 TRINITY_DN354_c4_g1~~TRINITY_DN354_c4_g1_i6.p1  ORF type:complete len:146 (+),score=21.30 TRINITY_DN354_c4_g1_i6:89-526(+)